jgi:DNA ligase-4
MGYGRMSCEEKLDGEYCQIHIDLSKLGGPSKGRNLSKGSDCIQIYSKSGKDSTQDRKALHEYAGALALLPLALSTVTSR